MSAPLVRASPSHRPENRHWPQESSVARWPPPPRDGACCPQGLSDRLAARGSPRAPHQGVGPGLLAGRFQGLEPKNRRKMTGFQGLDPTTLNSQEIQRRGRREDGEAGGGGGHVVDDGDAARLQRLLQLQDARHHPGQVLVALHHHGAQPPARAPIRVYGSGSVPGACLESQRPLNATAASGRGQWPQPRTKEGCAIQSCRGFIILALNPKNPALTY